MRRLILGSLIAFMIGCELGYAQGISVDIVTDGGPNGMPAVAAHGRQDIRSNVPADYLGRLLAYPGVGTDNFMFRAKIKACGYPDRNLGGWWRTAQDIDTSQVLEYRDVKSSTIISSGVESQVAHKTTCDNRQGAAPQVCTISESAEVTDTVSRTSQWHVEGSSSTTVGFRIGSSASFAALDAHQTFTFSGGYGQSETHSTTTSVGSTDSASTTVPPGTGVVMSLTVQRGTAQVQLVYDTDFDGNVTVSCRFKPRAGPFDGGDFPPQVVTFPIRSLYHGMAVFQHQPYATSDQPTSRDEVTETLNYGAHSTETRVTQTTLQ